jgi:hypothetical protein
MIVQGNRVGVEDTPGGSGRMSGLRNRERKVIEAVARHFSAIWENGGEDSPDAYLTIAGKRIAVEVTAINQMIAERGELARPRLRFDRVALGLVGGLRTTLREFVPDGHTVILTITAPIRLPAKTVAVLEDKIRACLARHSTPTEVKDTIHGNQIRVRLV